MKTNVLKKCREWIVRFFEHVKTSEWVLKNKEIFFTKEGVVFLVSIVFMDILLFNCKWLDVNSNSFPGIIQNIGLTLTTLFIAVAVLLVQYFNENGSHERVDFFYLTKRKALEHDLDIKNIAIAIGFIFIPLFFWVEEFSWFYTKIWLNWIYFFISSVGIFLLTRYLVALSKQIIAIMLNKNSDLAIQHVAELIRREEVLELSKIWEKEVWHAQIRNSADENKMVSLFFVYLNHMLKKENEAIDPQYNISRFFLAGQAFLTYLNQKKYILPEFQRILISEAMQLFFSPSEIKFESDKKAILGGIIKKVVSVSITNSDASLINLVKFVTETLNFIKTEEKKDQKIEFITNYIANIFFQNIDALKARQFYSGFPWSISSEKYKNMFPKAFFVSFYNWFAAKQYQRDVQDINVLISIFFPKLEIKAWVRLMNLRIFLPLFLSKEPTTYERDNFYDWIIKCEEITASQLYSPIDAFDGTIKFASLNEQYRKKSIDLFFVVFKPQQDFINKIIEFLGLQPYEKYSEINKTYLELAHEILERCKTSNNKD